MYLLDTNIILELLLDQEKADDVEEFLRNTQPENLYISEFTLYSLGSALIRRNMHDTFLLSVDDLLVTGKIRVVRIGPEDMQTLFMRHAGSDWTLMMHTNTLPQRYIN